MPTAKGKDVVIVALVTKNEQGYMERLVGVFSTEKKANDFIAEYEAAVPGVNLTTLHAIVK